MPVTGLSARQAEIAAMNVELFGIGVTGVTPSDKNCAEAEETDRNIERMPTDRSTESRRNHTAIDALESDKKRSMIMSLLKFFSTKPRVQPAQFRAFK